MVDAGEQLRVLPVGLHIIRQFHDAAPFAFALPGLGFGCQPVQIVYRVQVVAHIQVDDFRQFQAHIRQIIQVNIAEMHGAGVGPQGPVAFEEQIGQAQDRRAGIQTGKQPFGRQLAPVRAQRLI